jgi:hypothetical protein
MDKEWFKQNDVRTKFLNHDNQEWMVLYKSYHIQGHEDFSISAALTEVDNRAKYLSSPYWSIDLGANAPGFVQTYHGDETITSYLSSGNKDKGITSLVILRTYHDAKPREFEILEEFRLYHNLWFDLRNNKYIKILDDGTEEDVIVIHDKSWLDTEIKVRTKYLKQFQAAKQQDLMIAIDSIRLRGDGNDDDEEVGVDEWIDEYLNSKLTINDSVVSGVSRYIATRLVPAWPIEKSGKWPYDKPEKEFPEFIIGVDEYGDEILLGSSFHTDANYLKPVHFRKEVLKKYYDKPDLYSVEDGYLRCVGLWSVTIDNDHLDRVIVFLGDLGRDLPDSERLHWKNYNITPDKSMSITAFTRAFMGEFTIAQATDTIFKRTYKNFCDAWKEKYGWDLFKEMNGPDKNIIKQVRIPLNNSTQEFEANIDYLAKLIPESINDKELNKVLSEKVPNEKSISKLERYLHENNYPYTERDIHLLRDLFDVRSKIVAHRKGSDWETILNKVFGENRGQKAIIHLLHALNQMLDDISEHLVR